MKPKVSVVMSIYNGEKYIDECLPGILAQTFKDFELIIVDDGSTDHSIEKISQYRDSRIKLIKNKHDYIDSLNMGLREAQGKYIARMDVDDLMMPERLEKQYALMENIPNVAVCASWYIFFGQLNQEVRTVNGFYPRPLLGLIYGAIVSHSSVMLRKSFLEENNIQYEYYPYAEDYKLWFEIAKKEGIFYVIPEYLNKYRFSPDQISVQKASEQYHTHLYITKEVLEYLIIHSKLEREKINHLYQILKRLNEQKLLSDEVFIDFFTGWIKNNL